MPNAYTRALSTPTPQSEKDRPDQVKNTAGGFVFTVDDKVRLERFLILGTDGGTYYTDEKKLTKENTQFVIDLIQRNEALVESTVREISQAGRAYRNSPAIYTAALLFQYGKNKSSALIQDVCRTSTHLFEWIEYVKLLGGWGRAKRRAVAEWYTSKTENQLAYQVVKYRQRNGFTHRDVFRMAHPVGLDRELGNFVLGKELGEIQNPMLYGFKALQEATSARDVVETLKNVNASLPWEAIPTQFLKDVNVWKTLFYNGQLKGQALLRNITRLARLKAFDDMVFARDYAEMLVDKDMMRKTRLHPIQYLLALTVHENGQRDRKNPYAYPEKDWRESSIIIDALNAGFYGAFEYIEPAGKRTMIALDVSGSMSSYALGLDLTCAQIGAAMSMSVARSEPYYLVYGFSDGSSRGGRAIYATTSSYNRSVMSDLSITPNMNLNTVLQQTSDHNFGRTDCALPMKFAKENKLEVDTFLIVTDNETWAGDIHPYKALRNYRQSSGIDAKLAVAALTSTGFSIADPTDRGMLDVVGADANLPKLVAEFSAGRI